MERVVFEDRESGHANAFFRGIHWRREPSYDENGLCEGVWSCVTHPENAAFVSPKFKRLLEEGYRSSDSYSRKLQRFPRLGITKESADLWAIPTITQIKSGKARWLVDGLILKGSITLLSGLPGSCKTWLALGLGGAVSEGTNFLDRETTMTPVLYLDGENPPFVIHERRKMLRLRGDNFHVWGHWWEHRPPAIDDPRLLKLVRIYRPLIIIDSFSRFHSAEENSVKQMAKVFRRLKRLVDAGATILILHHQGKNPGSKYRGSSDILAGVDDAFAIRRKDAKNDILLDLECFKHRVVPEMTMTVRLNLDEHRFEVVDEASNFASPTVIKRIKSVITHHPGIKQRDLLEKAELPETNGRRILQEGDRVHWRSKHGKGKTLNYYLKD